MTLSVVEEAVVRGVQPLDAIGPAPLVDASLRRADRLRRSLVPSLLDARQTNESLANPTIELFEIASVYLPRPDGQLPCEELTLGMTSGGDYFAAQRRDRGAARGAESLEPCARLRPTRQELLDDERSAELSIRQGGTDRLLGYLGEVTDAGLKRFELRGRTTVAELRLAALAEVGRLESAISRRPALPAVTRDLNLVVDETRPVGGRGGNGATSGGPLRRRGHVSRRLSRSSTTGRGQKEPLVHPHPAIGRADAHQRRSRQDPRRRCRRLPDRSRGTTASVIIEYSSRAGRPN